MSNRPQLHSIGQIVAMLADKAEFLARDLLPGGRLERREWVCGGLDGRAGRGLSVCIAGEKKGVWGEFSAGQFGDMLDLIAACRTGGDKGEALKWARNWLGIGIGEVREVAPAPAAQRDAPDYEADAERTRARGAKLFGAALPWPGTPVEHYLAGRAIPLAGLQHVPRALRYHPECFCPERNRPAPAMLATIMRGPRMIGLHRTWIDRRPDGGWSKAALRSPKKVLGRQVGGYIPLSRGSSGQPLAKAPAGDVVALTEGIEEGMTIALECPEWRVLAAVNSGNLPQIDLPETVAEVVLCLQRDGENPAVARAIDAAVRRYTAEGRTVRATRPPEGFKDFNDWKQETMRQQQSRNAG